MAIVATASQYADYMKEMNKDLSGVSQWEKYFLQPTQQAFETAIKTEQDKTAYDISGAYNAYKKQQMQLMQQDMFSEGFQKRMEKQLDVTYEASAAQIAQQGAENVSNLQNAYQQTMAAAEADLLARGEQYQALESALQEYAIVRGFDPDYWKSESVTDKGQIATTMTKTGTADIAELMYDAGTSGVEDFRQFLNNNYSDVYDFYSSNLGEINTMYGIARDYRGGDLGHYNRGRNIEKYIRTITGDKKGSLSEWDKRVRDEMNLSRKPGMSDEDYFNYLTTEYEAAEIKAIERLKKEKNISDDDKDAGGGSLLEETMGALKGQYVGKLSDKDRIYYGL